MPIARFSRVKVKADNMVALRKHWSELLQVRSKNDGETWVGVDGVLPFWLSSSIMKARTWLLLWT